MPSMLYMPPQSNSPRAPEAPRRFRLFLLILVFGILPLVLLGLFAARVYIRLQNDRMPKFSSSLSPAPQSLEKSVTNDLHLLSTLEERYHGKFGTYTTDLQALGFGGHCSGYAKIGFSHAMAGAAVASDASNSIPNDETAAEAQPQPTPLPNHKDSDQIDCVYKKSLVGMLPFDDLTPGLPTATASRDHYLALAIVGTGTNPEIDVWTIDELKQIQRPHE